MIKYEDALYVYDLYDPKFPCLPKIRKFFSPLQLTHIDKTKELKNKIRLHKMEQELDSEDDEMSMSLQKYRELPYN